MFPRKKIVLILVLSIALILIGIILHFHFKIFSSPIKQKDDTSADWKIEEVARDLSVPWDIAFTSPDRAIITERAGSVRELENGTLTDLHIFKEVSSGREQGLMSVAVDPEYNNNKFLYFSLAYEKNGDIYVKIVRLVDEGNRLSDPNIIFDEIQGAQYHAGSAIEFGPDGKLYITTGDATMRGLAQDIEELPGKILRINKDKTIPGDNPFPGNPVWSYGHRNPQGIDWNSEGVLYSSEHGPSGNDGPGGGDEINIIEKGSNYGWPLVSHTKTKEGTISPIKVFTPAEAPASILVYSGKLFPEWKDDIFFGALRGEGIVRIEGKDKGGPVVEKLRDISFGRIRAVVESPDGSIYFSTSNKDGRGRPRLGDDKIFRIVPK